MTNSIVEPGTLTINKLKLKSLSTGEIMDIIPIVKEFSLYESLDHYPTMDIVIEDALSLITTFPIIGEEVIQVDLSIPDIAFVKHIETEFRVVGVTDFYRGKQTRNSVYILRCISKETFKDLISRVRKAYPDQSVSNMVKSVYEDYLKDEYSSGMSSPEIIVSESDDNRTIVIPSMRPIEAIKFLSREAKSDSYAPSNYILFKTFDNFYFKTFEEIINGTELGSLGGIGLEVYTGSYVKNSPDPKNPNNIQKNWSVKSSGNPDYSKLEDSQLLDRLEKLEQNKNKSASEQISDILGETFTNVGGVERSQNSGKPIDWQQMIDYRIHTIFDLEKSIPAGAFDNTVYSINPSIQYLNKEVFSYTEDNGKLKRISTDESASLILKDGTLSTLKGDSSISYIPTDFGSQIGQYDPKKDFLHLLKASNGLLSQIVVDVVLYGDTDRRIGETIALNFPEFSSTEDRIGDVHKVLGGNYVIVSAKHTYNYEQGYQMHLRCVKNTYNIDPQKLVDEAKAKKEKMFPSNTDSLIDQIKNPESIINGK